MRLTQLRVEWVDDDGRPHQVAAGTFAGGGVGQPPIRCTGLGVYKLVTNPEGKICWVWDHDITPGELEEAIGAMRSVVGSRL